MFVLGMSVRSRWEESHMVQIRRALSVAFIALILALSASAAFADDNGGGDHEIGDLNSSN